jgi:protein tyrosine phosphatase
MTRYVACQAPLENTIESFWHMVWERYTTIIVMLANIYEGTNKVKFHIFFDCLAKIKIMFFFVNENFKRPA